MKLSEELAWRGLINQTTYQDLAELDGAPITFYLGVDPSADSMTVGNLAIVLTVKRFIEAGHHAIMLIGGATGMIGDPDGKKQERDLKTLENIARNKEAVAAQYDQVLGRGQFELVDNYDWFKDKNYLDFLRDVGKNVPMRQMLNRQFVESRLAEDGAGISYAEFSYVLIQAYDFLHLSETKSASLQLCGADQWGNCIAGVDLIRRKTGRVANVFSIPLVVNKSTGRKFGKTEGGAVWLDPAKTSPYQFYQFWLNSEDESVEDFLKIFTFLTKAEIDNLVSELSHNPGERAAQKALAYDVTKLVHGEAVAQSAKKASEVLFGQANFRDLAPSDVAILKNELRSVKPADNLPGLLVESGLAASLGEARRLVKSGAVKLNGVKQLGETLQLEAGDNLLKCGKNSFVIIEN